MKLGLGGIPSLRLMYKVVTCTINGKETGMTGSELRCARCVMRGLARVVQQRLLSVVVLALRR